MAENKILSKQILKISGKNKFFEVMINSFNIDKVQINFFDLDLNQEKGKKQKSEINIYIDFSEMLVLCNDILSGRIAKLADNILKQVKETNNENLLYKALFEAQGGVTAENLAKRGKSRQDGKPLSRVFKILPSTKGNGVAFQAECGAGDSSKSATGGIVPAYGTKPEARVTIPLSYQQLKGFALIIQKHIDSYIENQYRTDAYIYVPENK